MSAPRIPHFALRLGVASVMLVLATLPARADDVRRAYLVQLGDKPISSYSGGVAGMQATQPANGKRLNLSAPAVQQYSAYLQGKQASVTALVAAAPVLHKYSVVLNGFSALLTDAEVRALRANSGVLSVTPDEPRHLVTSYTPTFLGLDQPDGLWSKAGGVTSAGEDIIVGVIDSGIWPENLAFTDRADGSGVPTLDRSASVVYGAPPAGWSGTCQPGEGFDAALCNNKLIGARYFNEGFLAQNNVLHWSDFNSARDGLGGNAGHGGHGTHTSSTAAGNHGVATTVDGLPMGKAGGIAPRARVAMYKVCWNAEAWDDPRGFNSCWVTDSVAAIEQAVTDGVHVLNYSISGGASIEDPVALAFLNAANAGVFVAAAAGNEGPDNGTLSHVSPWLTTVAASTHDRQLQSTLTLADGRSFKGASLNKDGLPKTAMIRAQDAVLPNTDPLAAPLCPSADWNLGAPILDAAKVAGKIVVCERGINDRVDKSKAVKEAGGVGMVLVDNGGGLVAEIHSVPTVHVSNADGLKIADYAATGSGSAALSAFIITTVPGSAPVIAGFSSRGPSGDDTNVMKPDLAAPGVSILAGVSPELTPEQRSEIIAGTLPAQQVWAFMDGTSMATPHVAGLAALLRQQHPGWSPAAIKSALMTSARNTLPDGLTDSTAGTLPWGQGAGNVLPNRANDPGLVYDAGAIDYKKYLCGRGNADQCGYGASAAADLNQAAIAVGNVLTAATVKRTVTNVGSQTATYNASISMQGYEATVQPASLTIAPGATASFTVTLKRTTAPDRTWQFGSLSWSDGTHTVRSPIVAISATSLTAPPTVRSTRVTDTKLLSIGTDYSGKLGVVAGGLKPVTKTTLTVYQAGEDSVDTALQVAAACNSSSQGVSVTPYVIPADTLAARFELFDRDTSGNGKDDLDLAVLDSSGKIAGIALHDGSNETVLLRDPAAGTYRVCVLGYKLKNGVSSEFQLSTAHVTANDRGGNLEAAVPTTVKNRSSATAALTWSGLQPGTRYLGAMDLLELGVRRATSTVIHVDTGDTVPQPAMLARAPKRDSRK
ncbi:S8 family serine peptidase [Pseudoduganella sp. FT55W]|uniref:S8 family serine peptidase n=1 Tax=Duganella rivi TaxID=2666083 RepID=A0A7X4GQD9_9BURK|nr:S8 family serine peptidase [Duganella rivi]MYM67309.1 S8 family serine peptidase [Duganella rivi]